MRWTSRLFLLLTFWQLAACALFEERKGPTMFYGPREQVFYAEFEEVWRSINLVLQPYPLRVSNMDQGVLETDEIKGYRIFTPVYRSEIAPTGETYRLMVRVIKGNLDKKSATKVTLIKEVQMKTDFFSEAKDLPSDGLEERAILYRIGREIQVERALARAQKKMNK